MTTRIEKTFTCQCGNENKIIIETNLENLNINCRCKCGKLYKFLFGEMKEISEVSEISKMNERDEVNKVTEIDNETGREIKGEEIEDDLLSKMEEKEEIEKLSEVSEEEEDLLSNLFGR